MTRMTAAFAASRDGSQAAEVDLHGSSLEAEELWLQVSGLLHRPGKSPQHTREVHCHLSSSHVEMR
jgi:hypothetical protein